MSRRRTPTERAVDIDIWRIYTASILVATRLAARLNRRVLAGEDLVRGTIQVDGRRVRYELRVAALAREQS